MLNLTPNSTNNLIIYSDTISNSAQTYGDYFLMVFTNTYSKQTFAVVPSITKRNTRFVELEVELVGVTGADDPLNGQIYLYPEGNFEYMVFNTSAPTLSEEGCAFWNTDEDFWNFATTIWNECNITVLDLDRGQAFLYEPNPTEREVEFIPYELGNNLLESIVYVTGTPLYQFPCTIEDGTTFTVEQDTTTNCQTVLIETNGVLDQSATVQVLQAPHNQQNAVFIVGTNGGQLDISASTQAIPPPPYGYTTLYTVVTNGVPQLRAIDWNGTDILVGATGATGSPGPAGATGSAGSAGATGQQGATGTNGTSGSSGTSGTSPNYTASSTDTVTIGTGLKSFNVQTGLSFTPGQYVVAANSASNYMTGPISVYNSVMGTLSMIVNATVGTGLYSNWVINLTAQNGTSGSSGTSGISGSSGTSGLNGLGLPSKVIPFDSSTDPWTFIVGTTGPYDNFSYKDFTFAVPFSSADYSIDVQTTFSVSAFSPAGSSISLGDLSYSNAAIANKTASGFRYYQYGDYSNSNPAVYITGYLQCIAVGSSNGSGIDGTSGSSGTSGISGSSGTSGINGSSGTSGIDGSSGTSGVNGTSGSSGTSGISIVGPTGPTGGGGGGSTPIRLTNQTLATGGWNLVGSYFQYVYIEANIATTTVVDFTPYLESTFAVAASNVYPYVFATGGSATFYADFAPNSTITGDVVITTVS